MVKNYKRALDKLSDTVLQLGTAESEEILETFWAIHDDFFDELEEFIFEIKKKLSKLHNHVEDMNDTKGMEKVEELMNYLSGKEND